MEDVVDVVWVVALAAGLVGAGVGAAVSAVLAARQVRRVADREIHRVGDLVATAHDQEWYWTPEWQAGEREADADLAAGRSTVYASGDEFLAALDTMSTDAPSRSR